MGDYKAMRSACVAAKGGRIAERAGIKAHAAVPHAHTGTNHKHGGKPKGYADGGAVEGGKAKSRHDRKGGHKVAVNVIVAPQGGQGQARPVPVPVPAPRPGMPPGMPPGGPPGMPPPGAGLGGMPPGGPPGMPPGMPPRPGMPPPGGPPMGMRPPGMARGGRMGMTAGAGSGEGRLQKARMMKHRDGVEDKDIGAVVA